MHFFRSVKSAVANTLIERSDAMDLRNNFAEVQKIVPRIQDKDAMDESDILELQSGLDAIIGLINKERKTAKTVKADRVANKAVFPCLHEVLHRDVILHMSTYAKMTQPLGLRPLAMRFLRRLTLEMTSCMSQHPLELDTVATPLMDLLYKLKAERVDSSLGHNEDDDVHNQTQLEYSALLEWVCHELVNVPRVLQGLAAWQNFWGRPSETRVPWLVDAAVSCSTAEEASPSIALEFLCNSLNALTHLLLYPDDDFARELHSAAPRRGVRFAFTTQLKDLCRVSVTLCNMPGSEDDLTQHLALACRIARFLNDTCTLTAGTLAGELRGQVQRVFFEETLSTFFDAIDDRHFVSASLLLSTIMQSLPFGSTLLGSCSTFIGAHLPTLYRRGNDASERVATASLSLISVIATCSPPAAVDLFFPDGLPVVPNAGVPLNVDALFCDRAKRSNLCGSFQTTFQHEAALRVWRRASAAATSATKAPTDTNLHSLPIVALFATRVRSFCQHGDDHNAATTGAILAVMTCHARLPELLLRVESGCPIAVALVEVAQSLSSTLSDSAAMDSYRRFVGIDFHEGRDMLEGLLLHSDVVGSIAAAVMLEGFRHEVTSTLAASQQFALLDEVV